jgi:hypothetical protein
MGGSTERSKKGLEGFDVYNHVRKFRHRYPDHGIDARSAQGPVPEPMLPSVSIKTQHLQTT